MSLNLVGFSRSDLSSSREEVSQLVNFTKGFMKKRIIKIGKRIGL